MTNFYYCEIQDHNGIAEVNCKALAEVQNKVDRLLPRKTVNLVGGRGRSAMATGQQIVGARMCTVRMRLLSAAVLRPDLRTLNPALPGEAAKQKTDDVLMRCRAGLIVDT